MTREQALNIRIGDTVTTSPTHSLDQFRGASFKVVAVAPISVALDDIVGELDTNEAIETYLSSLPPCLLKADEWGHTDLLMRVCVESNGTWGSVAHLGPHEITGHQPMSMEVQA
jgi:hypothetical protein|tara:strand:+ start:1890 stop:2231 length:342 start_codon:yes stop_codon:yes gene_type:complete